MCVVWIALKCTFTHESSFSIFHSHLSDLHVYFIRYEFQFTSDKTTEYLQWMSVVCKRDRKWRETELWFLQSETKVFPIHLCLFECKHDTQRDEYTNGCIAYIAYYVFIYSLCPFAASSIFWRNCSILLHVFICLFSILLAKRRDLFNSEVTWNSEPNHCLRSTHWFNQIYWNIYIHRKLDKMTLFFVENVWKRFKQTIAQSLKKVVIKLVMCRT